MPPRSINPGPRGASPKGPRPRRPGGRRPSTDGQAGAVARTTGSIVVLAASGPACRDLVLGILRRRLAGNPRIIFPMLAVEAALNAGGVDASLVLTRRQFRAFEADGAFALVWRDHGVRTGLPNTFLDPLARGHTLVISGPATLAIDARGLVGRVAVLAVGGELDRARQQLTPQACLKRLASPAVRQRLGRMEATQPTVAVAVSGSLGRSLDELTAAIEALAT